MATTRTPREGFSRADLRSAVYAVFNAVFAGSSFIITAITHNNLLLIAVVWFGVLAVFNAGMIGRHRK